MPRPGFTYPTWLPSVLSYSSLLVINTLLPFFAIITVNNAATGLEITLVTFNSLAGITLASMLIYKMLARSCAFNDVKQLEKKAFLCVTVLDFCAAVGWPIRLDREAGICARLNRRPHGTCHTALIILGLVMAWISVIVSLCTAVCTKDHLHLHGRKKRRPSPLKLGSSRPAISSPVLVHAGLFNEAENVGMYGGFTDVPLEQHGTGEA